MPASRPPLRARALDALWLVILTSSAANGCSGEDDRPRRALTADLRGVGVFDQDTLVDTESFTRGDAYNVGAVQAFLERTPHGGPSFLATYRSNGQRAAEAIVHAARRYELNPLVFLVRAEVDQGLIAAQGYPSPARRVEYAFGCGCTSSEACASGTAGFDQQLECLGYALRVSLEQIRTHGATVGGWGPGDACAPSRACITLDGRKILPTNEATAALYQYDPTVGEGGGGNWLFWNLWQAYERALRDLP